MRYCYTAAFAPWYRGTDSLRHLAVGASIRDVNNTTYIW